MDSYAKQFHAIVGEAFDPHQHELQPQSASALTAVILSMPETKITRHGKRTEYAGWSSAETTYLGITVENERGNGYQATCLSENLMVR